MPLDPKQIVQEARFAGLIRQRNTPCPPWPEPTADWSAMRKYFEAKAVKLPAEAGIARPPQPPAKRPRPKADPLRRKWITKGEAIAKGYSL